MKITRLNVLTTYSPISDWTYVKVETDDPSVFGWGECSLPSKPNGVEGAVRDLEKLLVGADPLDTEWCWQRMYRHGYWRGGPIQTSALSGVDIALWDIKGKVLNLPVYKLIGGAVRKRIRLYANLGLADEPEEFRRRARHALGLGYKVVKLYPLPAVGPIEGRAALDHIVACCEAVRDEVGSDRDFALDFHGRLSPGLAVVVEAALRHTRPLWIEEPVAAEGVAQLARLAEKFVTPIAVGERLVTRWAFREVFERELAAIVQPDVANAGGISELVRIAAMAEMYGLAFAPHNPNGPVQSAASLHLAAALQPFAMLEHRHEHHDFMRGLIGASVPAVEADGCTSLPTGVGLGVAVDEAFAASHSEGSWIPESFRADGSIADW